MCAQILIVDDHAETRQLIAFVLENEGHTVTMARNGAEGLEQALATPPDLMLLDVTMPTMNGYEVCRQIRADGRTAAVPIMMFTANAEAHEKWSGFAVGANDYMTKPASQKELIERVEMLLKSRPAPPLGATAVDAATAPEPPALRPPFIALMGARGGVGTTTAAINLAVTLAQQGDATTLLDCDYRQGHIAAYLGQTRVGGLQALGQLAPTDIAAGLERCRTPYGEHLHLLLAQADEMGERPFLTAEQGLAIIDALTARGEAIVADLGQSLTPLAMTLATRADVLLICTRPERQAIAFARRRQRTLEPWLTDKTVVRFLLFDVAGVPLPEEALAGALGHVPFDVIPLPYEVMARAANGERPLVEVAPASEAASRLRQLAQLLRTVARPRDEASVHE